MAMTLCLNKICIQAERYVVVVVTSVLLAAAGCTPAVDGLPVVGTVSYQGTPLDHGMISFLAPGEKPIGAAISPSGTYEAMLPAGEYQVAVVAPPKLPEGYREGDPLPPPDPNALPAQFARPRTSGLSATVSADKESQTIDFDLK